MSSLLRAIGEILRPDNDLVVRGGALRLEETAPESTSKPITLHKHGQAVMLEPDRVVRGGFTVQDRLFPLFRIDIPNISVMCDYIIFCEETVANEERLFILLCELKSKNLKGCRQQIENGKLLADYIVSMAMHHRAIQTLPKVEQRGLVFCSQPPAAPKGDLRKVRCRYAPLPNGFEDLPFAYYRSGQDYPLHHFCA